MKKLLIAITGIIAGSALYASPILNPAAPALITDGVFFCDDGCWGLKAGYRGNFVYNRKFNDSVNGVVRDFEYYSNSGVLTLTIWDRIDLYGFVGAASYNFDNIQSNNASPATLVYITGASRTRTNWGVGAKVVLWETCWCNCGTTYVGIDANYEHMQQNPLDRATFSGANSLTNGTSRNYYETQVSLGIAHRVSCCGCDLVPYIAGKWSNAGSSRSTGGFIGTTGTTAALLNPWRSYQHWGYAIGVSIVDANRMTVTGEARFKDEKALSIGAEFKF